MSHVLYFNATCRMMYAMVCTRPDILHVISIVNRHISNPSKEHWQNVKWILRYLHGTTNAILHFARRKDNMVGYVNSNYVRDLDKRRSITGYLFNLGGTTISWKPTLQSTVVLSTTKAKYIAVTNAIREAIWLRGLFGHLSSDL